MLLPKHHAEGGRVSLYEGYFYFTGFASPSQGVEFSNGAEEEEASGACWEMQHIRKQDQSFPTAHRQAKAKELASSGDSMGPANRCPAPGTGSVSLPANSTVTGEQAAASSQQPAASNTDHPEEGQRKQLYWPGSSPRLSQVGRSSPQP